MKKRAILLVMFVLLSAVFISGCAESSIKNTEQASEAVSNISTDVTDVSSTLEDIDAMLTGK